MRKIPILTKNNGPVKVLCLGAHSDDIEIGCGGTILSLLEEGGELQVYWVVFSANPERRLEAINSADKFLAGVVEKEVVVKDFRESFFPYTGVEIKVSFEDLKRRINPDIVFTHYRNDLHQDHRLISELTWNTFRDHLILEYEIIKYDGDLGSPNLFVHLSEEICAKKIKLLMNNFKSQHSHQWFTEETFKAILRVRGIESNAPHNWAEAFHARKLVVGQ